MNFYNDNDLKVCAWAGELVRRGLAPPGTVDSRSIREVQPADLAGYDQCHFFSGILGWSLALRLAGWPEDRPVWTGSCPCQPFSKAGRGRGTDDPRHLWPEFYRLIRECRPPVVFGEQVAAKAGRAWLATVRADMEALGYAFGAADLCAAGVGAPHIRQRLYWVADTNEGERGQGWRSPPGWRGSGAGRTTPEPAGLRHDRQSLAHPLGQGLEGRLGGAGGAGERAPGEGGLGSGLADSFGQRVRGGGRPETGAEAPGVQGQDGERQWLRAVPGPSHDALGRLDYTPGERADLAREAEQGGDGQDDRGTRSSGAGPWDELEWLPCRDGKWRPTQPGLSPLAAGVPARVVRLRGYGNSIVPQVAAEFVRAYMECVEA